MAAVAQTEPHRQLMVQAIQCDADAQRALIAGNVEDARAAFAAAAELYRQSWEAAPPGSYGRLVGMLKSAALAGDGPDAAGYVRRVLTGEDADSPTAAYALALAALIVGDDATAVARAAGMRCGSGAFERTADALRGLAESDQSAYAEALRTIVSDFEQRADHLTGVAIADTALMLERLASSRGITAGVESPLLPRAST